MKRKDLRSRSRVRAWRIVFAVAIFGVLYAVSRPMVAARRFYETLDQYAEGIRAEDPFVVNRYYPRLLAEYKNIARWRFLGRWIAPEASRDAWVYAALYQILMKNYTHSDVEALLTRCDEQKDFYACHLYGVARSKFYHTQYAAGERREALQAVTTSVAAVFEKALRYGPFENEVDRYNYDLVINPKTAEQMLKNVSRTHGVKLRIPGRGDLPERGNKLDESRKGGEGRRNR